MIEAKFTDESIKNVLKDLQKLGDKVAKSTKDNLHKAGINIESEAKLDLRKNNHIVTGRLWSSVHFESSTVNKAFTYSDNEGNSFDGALGVDPGEFEVYVGTNVEYADKIRRIDDFLFPPAEAEKNELLKRLKKDYETFR